MWNTRRKHTVSSPCLCCSRSYQFYFRAGIAGMLSRWDKLVKVVPKLVVAPEEHWWKWKPCFNWSDRAWGPCYSAYRSTDFGQYSIINVIIIIIMNNCDQPIQSCSLEMCYGLHHVSIPAHHHWNLTEQNRGHFCHTGLKTSHLGAPATPAVEFPCWDLLYIQMLIIFLYQVLTSLSGSGIWCAAGIYFVKHYWIQICPLMCQAWTTSTNSCTYRLYILADLHFHIRSS